MIHKNLRNIAQFSGGFTDLFILGSFRKYDPATKTWGSDFAGGADAGRTTTAAVAATYNLIQVTENLPAATTSQAAVARYVTGFPLTMAVVKYPFSDTGDNAKLDLGVGASLTAASNLIAGTAGDLELQDRIVVPAAAGVPLAPNVVSQWLTATITSATANVAALVPKVGNPVGSGVEIWIYATLLPAREWIYNRDA